MLCSSQTGKRKNMNESRDCEYATHLGILEEVVLAVDLRELEGGPGAEPLLLGQPVVLVLVVELLPLRSFDHGWLMVLVKVAGGGRGGENDTNRLSGGSGGKK